jgi:hypothetical protein
METNGDAVKTFVVIATVGFIMIGVAVSVVLHIWFKYDAPEFLKEPSTLRQKPLDDHDRD